MTLTARQVEVLRLMARGHTARESAHTLGLAVVTVEGILQAAYLVLGARNRAHAVRLAWERGVLGVRAC